MHQAIVVIALEIKQGLHPEAERRFSVSIMGSCQVQAEKYAKQQVGQIGKLEVAIGGDQQGAADKYQQVLQQPVHGPIAGVVIDTVSLL